MRHHGSLEDRLHSDFGAFRKLQGILDVAPGYPTVLSILV
jgi:hypothetical protein